MQDLPILSIIFENEISLGRMSLLVIWIVRSIFREDVSQGNSTAMTSRHIAFDLIPFANSFTINCACICLFPLANHL